MERIQKHAVVCALLSLVITLSFVPSAVSAGTAELIIDTYETYRESVTAAHQSATNIGTAIYSAIWLIFAAFVGACAFGRRSKAQNILVATILWKLLKDFLAYIYNKLKHAIYDILFWVLLIIVFDEIGSIDIVREIVRYIVPRL